MPKTRSTEVALAKLAYYQRLTHKLSVLPWALIEGENAFEAVNETGLRYGFNFVRYNPLRPRPGRDCAWRLPTAPEAMDLQKGQLLRKRRLGFRRRHVVCAAIGEARNPSAE